MSGVGMVRVTIPGAPLVTVTVADSPGFSVRSCLSTLNWVNRKSAVDGTLLSEMGAPFTSGASGPGVILPNGLRPIFAGSTYQHHLPSSIFQLLGSGTSSV